MYKPDEFSRKNTGLIIKLLNRLKYFMQKPDEFS